MFHRNFAFYACPIKDTTSPAAAAAAAVAAKFSF